MSSDFDDVNVSGLLRFELGTGSLVASGLCGLPPNVEPAALVASTTTHNLVLPSFGGVGAVVYALTTTGASAVLGGIQSIDKGLRPGQLLILVNANPVGGNTITTATQDSGSSVGNRITVAVAIEAGSALLLVYDGTQWIPFFPTTAG